MRINFLLFLSISLPLALYRMLPAFPLQHHADNEEGVFFNKCFHVANSIRNRPNSATTTIILVICYLFHLIADVTLCYFMKKKC